jgi:hypothetical protein
VSGTHKKERLKVRRPGKPKQLERKCEETGVKEPGFSRRALSASVVWRYSYDVLGSKSGGDSLSLNARRSSEV